MDKLDFEAINKLKSTDAPLFLAPNSDLSCTSRKASQFLFASLKQYSTKSPFDQLLTDGFDAEQIWQQIDLQSQPLITLIKREIKRFEKNPDQILCLVEGNDGNGVSGIEIKENGEVGFEGESEEFEGLSDEDEDEERENGELENEDDEEDDGESEEEEEEFEDDGDGVPEVEDDFLKIKDLEKYLVREEEREYGSEEKKDKKSKNKKRKGGTNVVDDDDEKDDDDGEDEIEEYDNDDGDDEFLMLGGDAGDEDASEDNIRYDDFFLPGKKVPKRKQKQVDKSDDLEEDGSVDGFHDLVMKDKDDDDDKDSETEDSDDKQEKGNLSTHQKEQLVIKAQIKQMEAENLAPKDWTMQGEVSASKRPVDSALEVDQDVVYNSRPPPVITEEVTASLEEIIKKRILEGHFNDVQTLPDLPSATPKETKELDDNKSKKGLAEIYEEDYAKQTGLLSAPLSFNDELKKEARDLFKKLCLKLDALSHFHFAPKPIIEDMSIQNNVPALAMEEIAPISKSDADMLAPEEVFSGKGDIKEENELTKDDRKKRRANKKRKFKAIKARGASNQAIEKPAPVHTEGKEQ